MYCCTLEMYTFTASFLFVKSMNKRLCFWICVNHTSSERSILSFEGTPDIHSSSLLIFSCFPFSPARGWDVSIGPDRCGVWTVEKQIEDEGKRKKYGRKKNAVGAWKLPDHRGPDWPLTLIMTLEVTPKVRGCVKVPLRQFTPKLGDDDLMQPSQPVWHDQCCSLLAAPKGPTSISNRATQGPLKAPYRQSQWAVGKETKTKNWESYRTERLFYFTPCSSVGADLVV